MITMEQVAVQIKCPVCAAQLVCNGANTCIQCGWVAIVYDRQPHTKEITRLTGLKNIKANDHAATAMAAKKLDEMNAAIDVQKAARNYQQERMNALREELALLKKQQEVLEADADYNVDLDELRLNVSRLQLEKERLSEKLGEDYDYREKPVAIRCTYDSKTNKINVIVTGCRLVNPLQDILVLGLAVSEKRFEHFSEADYIIPTKSRPINIFKTGEEMSLELKRAPNKPAAHYEVIHLYANLVSKLTIE